jgi:hypothetical protein
MEDGATVLAHCGGGAFHGGVFCCLHTKFESNLIISGWTKFDRSAFQRGYPR